MNEYSIKNIKKLYSWLEENPNGRMHKNGYSVIVFDCYDTEDTHPEYGCGFKVREHIFPTKEEAWLFFEKDLQEHGERDFWENVAWNEDCVVSVHIDEGGWTHAWIEKWEGFDEDVEMAWEFNGVKYKSLKSLWEEVPEFKGHYMEEDRPYILSEAHVAGLSVELSDSFRASCEEKEKELKAEEEERERRWKEYEESQKNRKFNPGECGEDGDLPF